MIAAGNDALFARAAEALEQPGWTNDPRFCTNNAQIENIAALHREIETALATRNSKDWLERLEAVGVPHAPINTVADVMVDPQVLARNMVVTALDPDLGPIRMQGNPVKLSAFDDPPTRKAAPELDGDRAAILEWLGDKCRAACIIRWQ